MVKVRKSMSREGVAAALADLDGFLRELRPAPGGGINRTWSKYRESAIQNVGDQAIAALIPMDIVVDSNLLTRDINNLARNEIITWSELVKIDFDIYAIRHPSDFGKRSVELGRILQQAAIAKLQL